MKVSASDLKGPLFQQLVDDMIATMDSAGSFGLAAPKIGEKKARKANP